jgi:peptidoglycan hydrolase-like protein with peptidoglycan-binding domain
MADELVLRAQRFVNSQYSSITGLTITEDGRTGWQTMYALTRALQFEIGITSLSNNFGPGTLSALQSRFPIIDADNVPHANFTRIVQSALYCKGYDGGEIDGVYNERVVASVTRLKQQMGIIDTYPGGSVTPKVFKGLLNMDPYLLVNYGSRQGSEEIQAVQRWLNGRYVGRQDFFIIPCDGHNSRDVSKSMLYAIQYELGMADGVANGAFGPGTQSGLKRHPLDVGDNGVWVSLFTAAMILNQRQVSFSSTFTSSLSTSTIGFQEYVALPPTGTVDFATWASLLVSYGDPARRGSACDCITTITPARAATLIREGYRHVGRYLCNVPGGSLDKVIKPGELQTISEAGLSCFPIYQTYGRDTEYFNYQRGVLDAYEAIEWAKAHGFKDGTRIYFAVDYDALDADVTNAIIPHFRGIFRTITESSRYRVGIYGPRNVCQRVSDAGYAETSFVCDMSSGFSGNLGYPMPSNWAFDQISTKGVGSGDGYIEIDNNIASGRDTAQRTFNPPSYAEDPDTFFDSSRRDTALEDVQAYLEGIGVPETGGDGWTDDDWATIGGNSNTDCFDAVVINADWLFTSLSRQLGMRKALIQAPVFWEMRQLNPADFAKDEAVKAGLDNDSSTGWGQIFAWVAIEARNYCVEQGIINGQMLDLATQRHEVWTKLHEDQVYNISTVAYLTIYNAFQINLPRPGLNMSFADIQRILSRYNGEPSQVTEKYGQDVGGLYEVLERHHRSIRDA